MFRKRIKSKHKTPSSLMLIAMDGEDQSEGFCTSSEVGEGGALVLGFIPDISVAN